MNGLGIGDEDGENRYRLVQTKAPDGYKKAGNTEFTISMTQAGKTVKVSAADSGGKTLPVEGNVVCVSVVNAAGAAKPVSDTGQDSTPSGNGQQSGSSSSGGNQTGTAKEVVVTYYRDGDRDFWYTHKEEEFDADGMMDTANIKTYASAFAGCRLEKITVNGETVDALPAKVPYGTQIGYWYVTN